MLPSYEHLAAFKMSVCLVLRLEIRDDMPVFKRVLEFACDLLFPKFVFSQLVIIYGYPAVEIVFDACYSKLRPVHHGTYRKVHIFSRRLENAYMDNDG